jgi:hypothetical protein
MALLGGLVLPAPSTAGASGPTGRASEVLAVRWLAAQIGPEGYAESPYAPGAPDPDSTRDIAFALAATGLDQTTFDRAFAWLVANIEDVIAGDGADSPGDIGWLLLLVAAVGGDPTDLGGINLLDRLAATLDGFEPGLYGSTDPTFDGVFRQAVALIGLVAAGATPPQAAIDWLLAQQCEPGAGDPQADGGFGAYRDPADPCVAPDPANYAGPDTDSTSLAVLALTSLGLADPVAPAIDFLATTQDAGGGFAWYAGSEPVPNSTGLAIGAILAAGEDPTTERWVTPAGNPVTWIVDRQLPCGDPDAGAFTSIYSEGGPDQFATRQAVIGVALGSLPLDPRLFEEIGDPCAAPGVPGGDGPTGPAGAAEVAETTPHFTG